LAKVLIYISRHQSNTQDLLQVEVWIQFPRFSPDGKTVMYIKRDRSGNLVGYINLVTNVSMLFPIGINRVQSIDWWGDGWWEVNILTILLLIPLLLSTATVKISAEPSVYSGGYNGGVNVSSKKSLTRVRQQISQLNREEIEGLRKCYSLSPIERLLDSQTEKVVSTGTAWPPLRYTDILYRLHRNRKNVSTKWISREERWVSRNRKSVKEEIVEQRTQETGEEEEEAQGQKPKG